ncbi:MAG: (Fe-S)-binding protein [Deltaproteobacteria bacterium]|nr:(Fe-S)-binding protein [Deltaproteobacteria bacterium]
MSGHGLPCVHCGLCLDTCPTYRLLGTEADSPRGRIYIMEAIESGELELDAQAATHLSRCLGCLACESACPSGVSYGRRIDEFRPQLAARAGTEGILKNAAQSLYTNPSLVDLGLRGAALLDRFGLGALRRQAPGLGLLPSASTSGATTDNDGADWKVTPLRRSRVHQPLRARLRVALLSGCVGDQMMPQINRDSVEVLQRNGIEVVEMPGQGCCGALALHSGRRDEAVALARANLAAFARIDDVDAFVTSAAGCGALVRDYDHLLAGTDVGEEAEAFSALCRDVCELLVEVGFKTPSRPLTSAGPVAYHDACHLLHARGIAAAPRKVCEVATGSAPVDLGENNLCCGSAGSYNLDHPVLAEQLGRRKAVLARQSPPTTVAVGNVGCMLQIARALELEGVSAVVRHPVQLLAAAYRQSAGRG